MVDPAPLGRAAKMISAAPIMTELFLSGAALAGLWVLAATLHQRDQWDPINRRFLFGVRVLMTLFAGRVLVVLTDLAAFRILELLAAALIPLAVLLLTEGLLRRHAPPFVKAIIGIGAVIFGFSAFWYSDSIDPARLVALLCFQVAGFCLAGWLILTRDRASLLPSENITVTRLGLTLILFVPMALGDFLLLYLDLPVQFSALGVLVLCWLAIGLARRDLGHRATLFSLFLMIAAAVLLGLLVGFLVGIDRDGGLMLCGILVAATLLVMIYNDARALQSEARSLGLLQHMATAEISDPVAFLQDLQAHPLVEGAVIVSEESLVDLQSPVLDRIFDATPVLRRADPPALGVSADDHIAHLFARYSATHIMLASVRPRVLIALSMPAMRASDSAELELQVVQRMAVLISERTGGPHG
ncbi:hypothetical protein [Yoonia sp. SS1-5]|uniref:Uncharacterized protein n=1 Tax=Yoonia rhodophyticola TaxID=3137370 RepID=A0AAN0M8A6_9RHOB